MTGISSKLWRLLRQQQLYLAIAASVYVVFWTMNLTTNVTVSLVYSIFLGNFATLLIERMMRRFGDRRPAHQWAIFVPTVLVTTAIAVTVSTYLVYWIVRPPRPPFGLFLAAGWKFPSFVTGVVAMILFAYSSTKERLERDKRQLQRSMELEAARRELQEQELQRAREIQQSLLPKAIPQVTGFEIEGAWEPARVVGGDYYDVIRLGPERVGICIADVAGKSVSAALLMANVQAMVRAFASDAASPAQLCTRVNAVLCSNIAAGKFVTMFYGVLDGRNRRFEYANAGHLYPILVSASGAVKTLDDGGALLGVLPQWQYENQSLKLEPGDRLLLFTDGITEAESNGEEFGEERLARSASTLAGSPPSEMKQRLLAEVNVFCDSQLQDDATLLVIGKS